MWRLGREPAPLRTSEKGRAMKPTVRCPNPRGCDGELYARTEDGSTLWCPKCGFAYPRGENSAESRSEDHGKPRRRED